MSSDDDTTLFDVRLEEQDTSEDEPDKGKVKFQVADSNGSPLSATCTVEEVDGNFRKSKETSDSGFLQTAVIENVPKTKAVATIESSGYKTQQYEIGPDGDVNWDGTQSY